jgi:hypothetical protein
MQMKAKDNEIYYKSKPLKIKNIIIIKETPKILYFYSFMSHLPKSYYNILYKKTIKT